MNLAQNNAKSRDYDLKQFEEGLDRSIREATPPLIISYRSIDFRHDSSMVLSTISQGKIKTRSRDKGHTQIIENKTHTWKTSIHTCATRTIHTGPDSIIITNNQPSTWESILFLVKKIHLSTLEVGPYIAESNQGATPGMEKTIREIRCLLTVIGSISILSRQATKNPQINPQKGYRYDSKTAVV